MPDLLYTVTGIPSKKKIHTTKYSSGIMITIALYTLHKIKHYSAAYFNYIISFKVP